MLVVLLSLNSYLNYAMQQPRLVDQQLFVAAQKNNHGDVARLLEQHADPNILIDGQNAIHAASKNGFSLVLTELLNHGGDVSIRAPKYKNSSALACAANFGHVEACKVLLSRHADVQVGLNDGVTPLHLCAMNGNEAIAQLLVAAGAQINAKNNDGATPLHFAAETGKLAVARFLITHNADVNVKLSSEYGFTPLHSAAEHGHIPIVELLLNNGALVNARGLSGTPLHVAAYNRHAPIVAMLIRGGADVCAEKPGHKGTPLHMAVATLDLETVMQGDDAVIQNLITTPSLIALTQAQSLAKKSALPFITPLLFCFKKISVQIPKEIQKIICGHVITPFIIPHAVDKQLEQIKKLFTTINVVHGNHTPAQLAYNKGMQTDTGAFCKLAQEKLDPEKVEQYRKRITWAMTRFLEKK